MFTLKDFQNDIVKKRFSLLFDFRSKRKGKGNYVYLCVRYIVGLSEYTSFSNFSNDAIF